MDNTLWDRDGAFNDLSGPMINEIFQKLISCAQEGSGLDDEFEVTGGVMLVHEFVSVQAEAGIDYPAAQTARLRCAVWATPSSLFPAVSSRKVAAKVSFLL